jgi:hypothetical protein
MVDPDASQLSRAVRAAPDPGARANHSSLTDTTFASGLGAYRPRTWVVVGIDAAIEKRRGRCCARSSSD